MRNHFFYDLMSAVLRSNFRNIKEIVNKEQFYGFDKVRIEFNNGFIVEIILREKDLNRKKNLFEISIVNKHGLCVRDKKFVGNGETLHLSIETIFEYLRIIDKIKE